MIQPRYRFHPLVLAALLAAGCNVAPPEETAVARQSVDIAPVDLIERQLLERRAELGLSSDYTFRSTAVGTDSFGATHYRFDEYFQGVRVVGGSIIVHVDARGATRPDSDGLIRDIRANTQAAVEEARAIDLTTRDLGFEKALSTTELQLRPTRALFYAGTDEPAPDDAEINAADLDWRVTGWTLAWRVRARDIEATPDKPSADYLIDATSADILERGLDADEMGAVGHSQFSGDVTLDVSGPGVCGGTSMLYDPSRNGNSVRTYGTPVSFESDTGEYGDGTVFTGTFPGTGPWSCPAVTLPSWQTAAVDAAFGLQVVTDMMRKVFLQNGWDGQGHVTNIYVHGQGGSSYYNGWPDHDIVLVDDSISGPHTSVDAVGHEWGHGLNDLGNVDIGKQMNEGNSDIWGMLTRYYFNSSAYLFHQDHFLGTPDASSFELFADIPGYLKRNRVRFMYHPSKNGSSPDYFTTAVPGLESHVSAGVISRFFYYLSQGATEHVDFATNKRTHWESWSPFLPWGMKYGLGLNRAAHVYGDCFRFYATSDPGFAKLRDQCLYMVHEQYGYDSDEDIAVQNAFAGINVGKPYDPYPAGPALTLMTSAATSAGGQQLTFSLPPLGAPVLMRKAHVLVPLASFAKPHVYQVTRSSCSERLGVRLMAPKGTTVELRGPEADPVSATAGRSKEASVSFIPSGKTSCKTPEQWTITVTGASPSDLAGYNLYVDDYVVLSD